MMLSLMQSHDEQPPTTIHAAGHWVLGVCSNSRCSCSFCDSLDHCRCSRGSCISLPLDPSFCSSFLPFLSHRSFIGAWLCGNEGSKVARFDRLQPSQTLRPPPLGCVVSFLGIRPSCIMLFDGRYLCRQCAHLAVLHLLAALCTLPSISRPQPLFPRLLLSVFQCPTRVLPRR